MTVHSDLGSRQPEQPERTTKRLTPPPGSPTTRAQLLDALLVERFGTPTPEHHNPRGPLPIWSPRARTWTPTGQPSALRLIIDNQPSLFDTDEQVA